MLKKLTKLQKIIIGVVVAVIVIAGTTVGVVLGTRKPKDDGNPNPKKDDVVTIYGTEVTEEVVNNTIKNFYNNSKAVVISDYLTELDYGVKQTTSFNNEFKFVTNDGKLSSSMVMSQHEKVEFNMEETKTLWGKGENEILSALNDEFGEFVKNGDLYTFDCDSEAESMFCKQLSDIQYESYFQEEDKFYKSTLMGDVRNEFGNDITDLFPSFIGEGTYDESTHFIHINNMDLKANDKSDYYLCEYDVVIENGLISKITLEQLDKDGGDERNTQHFTISYGDQSITLPSEDSLLTCNHDDTYEHECEINGSFFVYTKCDECEHTISYEEVTLDENGYYPNGEEYRKNAYFSYEPRTLIKVTYNGKTNVIKTVYFSSYKARVNNFNSYTYIRNGSIESSGDVYVSIFNGLNDGTNLAWIAYGPSNLTKYVLLKDPVVDETEKTVSGTELVKFEIGQVLDLD